MVISRCKMMSSGENDNFTVFSTNFLIKELYLSLFSVDCIMSLNKLPYLMLFIDTNSGAGPGGTGTWVSLTPGFEAPKFLQYFWHKLKVLVFGLGFTYFRVLSINISLACFSYSFYLL